MLIPAELTHIHPRRTASGRKDKKMILYEIVDRLKDEVDPKTVYLAYPHQHSERQTTLADIVEDTKRAVGKEQKI